MSASTIRTYPADVADFYEWVQDAYDTQIPRNLYREHVLAYRDNLTAQKIKPRTINHKLSALRKYNEYLIAKNTSAVRCLSAVDFLTLKPARPKGMSIPDTQIGNFIAKVQKDGNARNTALVTLQAHTGMTLGEALALTLSDIDWKAQEVKVGKDKEARHAPLPIRRWRR